MFAHSTSTGLGNMSTGIAGGRERSEPQSHSGTGMDFFLKAPSSNLTSTGQRTQWAAPRHGSSWQQHLVSPPKLITSENRFGPWKPATLQNITECSQCARRWHEVAWGGISCFFFFLKQGPSIWGKFLSRFLVCAYGYLGCGSGGRRNIMVEGGSDRSGSEEHTKSPSPTS